MISRQATQVICGGLILDATRLGTGKYGGEDVRDLNVEAVMNIS